jgi:hypothetical protein
MNVKQMNYSRNSFERFGDDFCELILSYLPLNDKLRYECLSKQWQTLVFNLQFKLIIDNFNGKYSVKGLKNSSFEENKFYTIFTINQKSFESLLKKCRNISRISFDWKYICDEQTFISIANNCRHLRRISISRTDGFCISDEVLTQFGKSCAENLIYFRIDVNFSGNLKLFFSYCHNLKTIYGVNDSQKFIDCETNFLPNLEEIDFMVTQDSDLDQLNILAEKYYNKMKKLVICIKIGDSNNEVIGSDINIIFTQISRFVKLEYLKLNMNSYFGQPFSQGIQIIAQNCTQLKFFDFESYDTIILENFFQLFEKFRSLEYLNLHCRYLYRYESIESVNQFVNYGKVKCLENCKNLKRLKLNLLYLNDSNLENIDLYLPNLKLIELKSTKHLTIKSLHSIAKLKQLTTLRVCCTHYLNESSICHLINSCPLLNNIYFDGNPNINRDIIEALITKARKNQKINYQFYYSGVPVQYEALIPSNLFISNFWDKQWY